MLYQNNDGSFTLDDKPTPSWWSAEREREARKREAENAALYERMCEQVAEIERERAIAAEVAERDETIELAELANEAAMVELEQLGCIEFEPQFNWNAKSTPEDRGWSRAVLDIIAEYGADVAESVFELF